MIARSRTFGGDELREIRERIIFEAGKLDPQTYDHATVAPFALRVDPTTWRTLSRLAERLAAELHFAEAVLLRERRYWRRLGLSRRMRALLSAAHDPRRDDIRFCRFDFHPTADGWRLSEVNADVPGGFIEAGAITRIVASYLPPLAAPPDPARDLARAIASRRARGDIALIHATSYSDDQQVMRRIRADLGSLGIGAHFAAPDHVRAVGDGVRLATNNAAIGGIVRFFPGEWLANLRASDRTHWTRIDARVFQANPLSALLVQSKRLPLVSRRLGLQMPAWDASCPRVSAVGWRRFAPRLIAPGHVLKPVWGRVGEGVCLEGITEARALRRSSRWARLHPRDWVFQERFDSEAVSDRVHACLGVYVIDGKASGVYARIAPRPLIDARAQDVAVLLDPALDRSTDAVPHVA